MELKFFRDHQNQTLYHILIEPVGIEIKGRKVFSLSVATILIEPVGIEIHHTH